MNLKMFLTALILIPVIDFVWLGIIASNFYKAQMGPLARVTDGQFHIVYWAAFVVYLLLALGVGVFVSARLQGDTPPIWAFIYGALLGVIVYGVYDFTNHATLVHWPLPLMAADILWGGFVTGIASLAGHMISKA